MAEEIQNETEFAGEGKPSINIEQILQSERAWEYLLLDIIKTEQIDPWDIDITKLTQNYIERVRKMRELDLRMPARVIFAAAFLLRMQSETLTLTKSDDSRFDELFGRGEGEDIPSEEPEIVPLLQLHLTRKPVRKITLSDLISTLETAFEKSHKERALPHQIALHFPEVDIVELIERLYRKIYSIPENRIPFSTLLPEKTANAAVDAFLPLLHLVQEQKVDFEQESLFSEIFILKQHLASLESKN